MTLNKKCNRAALLAVLCAPKELSIAVIVLPILEPSKTGNAAPIVIKFCIPRACTIPTTTDELCTNAVAIKPTKTPIIGDCNVEIALTKKGVFPSGDNPPSMICMPKNKIPKPSIASPVDLRVLFFPVKNNNVPNPIKSGAY